MHTSTTYSLSYPISHVHACSYQIFIIIITWDMPKRSNQPHEIDEIMPKSLVCTQTTTYTTLDMDMYRDEMR